MRLILATTALLLIASLAQAHGGVEPREIDERILADGTGNGDYGASGTLDEGGIDILSLDMRVATVPGTAVEAVVARVIVQGGEAAQHRIELSVGDDIYAWTTSDLEAYTSEGFAAIAGPFPVGDGHPKALEGFIPIAELGLDVGDVIDGLTVTSKKGSATSDVMPGSWFYGGQEVPNSPGSSTPPSGSYTYAGLPDWFALSADTDLISGDTEIVLDVRNGLSTLDQEVQLTVVAPFGLEVALDRESLLLAPGETRNATLSVSGFGSGEVQIIAESNLAGARVVTIPIEGEAIVGNGGGVVGPLLNTGQAYQYRFTTPAVFEYHCHPHPFMEGVVTIVEDDPTDTPQTHIVRILDGESQEQYGFSPAELTVQVNDTVVWINDGDFQHNVHGSTGLGGGHDHDHDHGDHTHGDPDNESPAPALGLVLVALAFLARRRS